MALYKERAHRLEKSMRREAEMRLLLEGFKEKTLTWFIRDVG